MSKDAENYAIPWDSRIGQALMKFGLDACASPREIVDANLVWVDFLKMKGFGRVREMQMVHELGKVGLGIPVRRET